MSHFVRVSGTARALSGDCVGAHRETRNHGLPFYNEDLDVEGAVPAAVVALRESVADVDGFLLVGNDADRIAADTRGLERPGDEARHLVAVAAAQPVVALDCAWQAVAVRSSVSGGPNLTRLIQRVLG